MFSLSHNVWDLFHTNHHYFESVQFCVHPRFLNPPCFQPILTISCDFFQVVLSFVHCLLHMYAERSGYTYLCCEHKVCTRWVFFSFAHLQVAIRTIIFSLSLNCLLIRALTWTVVISSSRFENLGLSALCLMCGALSSYLLLCFSIYSIPYYFSLRYLSFFFESLFLMGNIQMAYIFGYNFYEGPIFKRCWSQSFHHHDGFSLSLAVCRYEFDFNLTRHFWPSSSNPWSLDLQKQKMAMRSTNFQFFFFSSSKNNNLDISSPHT